MYTTSSDLFDFARRTLKNFVENYESNEYEQIDTDNLISLLFLADKLPKSIGVRDSSVDISKFLLRTKQESSLVYTTATVHDFKEVLKLAILSVEFLGAARVERYIKEAHQKLTFNTYAINAWSIRTGLDHLQDQQPIDYAIIALAGEVGEVANLYKKVRRGDFTLESKKDEMVHELGDVLWYLNDLCIQLGTSLEEVANANLKKLDERYNSQETR